MLPSALNEKMIFFATPAFKMTLVNAGIVVVTL